MGAVMAHYGHSATPCQTEPSSLWKTGRYGWNDGIVSPFFTVLEIPSCIVSVSVGGRHIVPVHKEIFLLNNI